MHGFEAVVVTALAEVEELEEVEDDLWSIYEEVQNIILPSPHQSLAQALEAPSVVQTKLVGTCMKVKLPEPQVEQPVV